MMATTTIIITILTITLILAVACALALKKDNNRYTLQIAEHEASIKTLNSTVYEQLLEINKLIERVAQLTPKQPEISIPTQDIPSNTHPEAMVRVVDARGLIKNKNFPKLSKGRGISNV